MQTAIRSQLDRRTSGRQATVRRPADRRRQLNDLKTKPRKLLKLYYADNISFDGFRTEEERIVAQIAALATPDETDNNNDTIDHGEQFERVLAILSDLDWDQIWNAVTDTERRMLLDEFVPNVLVHADHLEFRGAGELNVALHEVGLRNPAVETAGVGGPS